MGHSLELDALELELDGYLNPQYIHILGLYY